jgi:hypothetical protein
MGVGIPVCLVLLVFLRWNGGHEAHAGLFGYLPVSDAHGYYHCAVAARYGLEAADQQVTIILEWCSRRAIWPVALNGILALSGDSAGVALLLQAALIGLALALAASRVLVVFGWPAAVVLSAVAVHFAFLFATGSFLTENWGLTAGLIACAYLLQHTYAPSPFTLAFGLTFLSIAMSARAGALFVLPLVALWALLSVRDKSSSAKTWLPLLGLLAGPALHAMGALHLSGSLANSGGNFAVVFYALSNGSRDWQIAYTDFAELFATRPETEVFRIIYGKSLDNIIAAPSTLLMALFAAAIEFFKSLFTWQGIIAGSILKFLFCVGLIVAISRRAEPRIQLVVLVFIGECLSAPWIIDSGGERVFAATIWVRPIIAGIGLVGLAEFLRMRLIQTALPRHSNALLYGLSGSVVALSVAGLVPKPDTRDVFSPPDAICSSKSIVARVGSQSPAVLFSGRTRFPIGGPMELESVPKVRDASDLSWDWTSFVGPLSAGAAIIAAYDVTPGRPATFWPLILESPLPPSDSGLFHICIGSQTNRKLGGNTMYSVESIKALP